MKFANKRKHRKIINRFIIACIACHIAVFSFALSAENMPNSAANIFIELHLKQQHGEYHPPYVAAWIENDQRQSVRTLLLWRKEPKWLKDIRRWWRNVGRKSPDLVDAITSATHAAGTFPLSYTAVDDQGKSIPNGQYTLYIEVVREKGGRAIIKQPFVLNEHPQNFTLKQTAETGAITFSVTPRN